MYRIMQSSEFGKRAFVITFVLFTSSQALADPLQANFSHLIDWNYPYKVNFKDLSTPSFVNQWTWEFGDGTVSTEMNPSHIYSFAGEYTVKLTVKSGAEQSNYSKTITVTTELRAIINASLASGPPPLTVDLSCAESTGLITSHTWSISPNNGFTYISGGANSINPTIRFDVTGVYTITLTVSDGAAPKTATQAITVKSQPLVDFIWAAPVYAGTPVQFLDKTVLPCNYGVAWQWNFPMSSSTSQNPTYTFDTPGDWDVSLRILDGCNNVVTKIKRVKVLSQAVELTPSFTSSKISIRKGETVDFYDTSSPHANIVGWFWNYDLPPDFQGDIQANKFMEPSNYEAKASFTYNTAGVFKARLQVTSNLGDRGPIFEQIIQVRESPELETEYSKKLSAMDPNAQSITGISLDGTVHAVLVDNKAVNVYKRTGGAELWKLTEQFNPTASGYSNLAVKIKNNAMIVLRTAGSGFPVLHYFDAVGNSANNALSIQSTTQNQIQLSTSVGGARFDFYDGQAVYLNVAADGVYLVLVTKTTTWSASTITKVKLTATIGTDLVVGNVFIDQRYIVAHVNGLAYVVSKTSAGVWDFANKKIISAPPPAPGQPGFFRDIAYANNTIMGCYIPFVGCGSRTWSVANIYEVGPSGWQDNMAPTASFHLDIDPDINDGTLICEVQSHNTPNALSLSNKYAAVKVGLRNGSGALNYKIYVFKKFYDFWIDSYQTYKINYTTSEFAPIVSGPYLMDYYAPNTGSRVGIYNFDEYCKLVPFTSTDFTVNSAQSDVVKGAIVLGGGTSAVFDTGAKAKYIGTVITLKPNLSIKSGANVTLSPLASCDDLYFH
ncbi:PKD domain-containing protein [Chryseolinea lacunae]|uniref:PKD domain-containing protein n=1 Tax=Chryseolinea lacunae TaxID=2801331 RepID=A0ABS1L1U6_9BACT|nr:PKD domain-containing protein [Chryseolinea lacunae]MBL0745696.1 PKD domain-containing protein [Chryseolinea lacunae]